MNKNLCTICFGQLGKQLFALENLPLVDSFTKSKESSKNILRQSIRIHRCSNCYTVQILDPIDTSDIYKEYIYSSKSSPDLDEHFLNYAKQIYNKFEQNANILEIGGNDGLFLEKLNQYGFENLTLIDPSPQSKNLNINNVILINDFLNTETIKNYSLPHYSYDLIFANNCFSHITNFLLILKNLNLLLSQNGTIVVEVQSLLSMFENIIFDYIYHEHIYYHSLISFTKICNLAGLKVYDVEHVNTKGGSYRLYISKVTSDKLESSKINYWKYRESLLNINSDQIWLNFNKYLEYSKKLILHEINKYEKIFAYGASATGTVLIDFYDIEKKIEYIIDDNPLRQGLYSPGTGIPIHGNDFIIDENYLCVILSWRHSKIILDKLKNFKGAILVPLPFMKIIKNEKIY